MSDNSIEQQKKAVEQKRKELLERIKKLIHPKKEKNTNTSQEEKNK